MNAKLKGKEFEKVVVIGDTQIPFQEGGCIQLVKQFLKNEKPDTLVLNGDIMDCFTLGKYPSVPNLTQGLEDEIRQTRALLGELRAILPKAEIIYIEGNHEFRLRRYIIDYAREIYRIRGITINEQLGLADLGIRWIGTQENTASWFDTYIKRGNLYIGHWKGISQHSAYTVKNLIDKKGVSMIQAHTHRGGTYYKRYTDGRIIVGQEGFCLTDMNPAYGKEMNWEWGFIVVHINKKTGEFHLQPIHIHDDYTFMYGNKLYTL